jgi:adenylate cyclase
VVNKKNGKKRKKHKSRVRVRHRAVRQRKLAAIMFTDMVGYTTLSQRDESLSLALVNEQRRLLRPIFKRHSGREIQTIGDAFLVEFQSALDATRCAYDIQRTVREYNISLPEHERFALRVGVHVGDVIESKSGDISGDAVNIASRIEPLAEHGGVCLTRQVYDHVQNKFDLPLESLGFKILKNVRAALEVYKMVMPWEQQQERKESKKITLPELKEAEQISQGQLDPRRIAILPFSNLSPNPNDEYFADGMTEEIISAVSKITSLQVIARTSVIRYKGSSKGIEEIGRELKAGTILEGSVRKADEKLRITAQLIDSKDSRHLWSETYDRELKDIFAIQTDISKTVADALKIQLLPSERRRVEKVPTHSTEAYVSYLKGRQFLHDRTKEGMERAIDFFQKAIEIDSSYALAYSGLADAYTILADFQYIPSLTEAFPKAEAAAKEAIQIDEDLAEAHVSMSSILGAKYYDHVGEERELKRAIELDPSYAQAHLWYGRILTFLGRFEEALRELRMTLRLDPVSFMAELYIARISIFTGQLEQAIQQFNELMSRYPSREFWLQGEIGEIYLLKGNYEGGLAQSRKALELSPPEERAKRQRDYQLDAARVYAKMGKREDALKMLRKFEREEITDETIPLFAVSIALVYTALGDSDLALQWLDRGRREYDRNIVALKVDPMFNELRTHNRFIALIQNVGLMSSEEALEAQKEIQRKESTKTTFDKKRIAVLPFANISPDPNDEYFADGMTEELISTISKISSLQVIARTSVMSYKSEQKKKIDEISKELKVGTILEGSVRKAGDMVRITAQLIDCQDSRHLWSETYDRDLKDIFAIQSDISQTVAGALKIQLLPIEKERIQKQPTRNPEAHALYLKGLEYERNSRVVTTDYKQAFECFEKSTRLDPNFAQSYAALAYIYTRVVLEGGSSSVTMSGLPYSEALSKAKRLIARALEIDRDLPEAYVSRSNIDWALSETTREGWLDEEKDLKRALELNPSFAFAHQSYAFHLMQDGRFEEAISEYWKAFELDPLSWKDHVSICIPLIFSRNYEAALNHLKHFSELYPMESQDADTIRLYARIYIELGRFDNALKELNRAIELARDDYTRYQCKSLLGVALARHDRLSEAYDVVKELEETVRSKLDSSIFEDEIAVIFLALGEKDKAIELLERAYQKRKFIALAYLKVDTLFDSLRSDHRFIALLNKLGFISPEEALRAEQEIQPKQKEQAKFDRKRILGLGAGGNK